MIPTPANMQAMNGKQFELDPHLLGNPNQDGLINRWVSCRAVRHTDRLEVRPSRGGHNDYGVWVPYCGGRAVMAHLDGGHTWFGSGPFSGCILSVGLDHATGQVYMAHIAQDGGKDRREDSPLDVWNQQLAGGQTEIWYQNKLPLPDVTFFAGGHMFVGIAHGEISYMVRVDVNTNGVMGGASGEIFNVETFKE